MYKVYCDSFLIYDLNNDELVLISPKLTLEDSCAGTFDFTIPPTHPYYDKLEKMVSQIKVEQDGVELWSGRITEEKTDFWKRKRIHVEGELAYLNDTLQPPKEYHDMTVRGFLQALLDIHNSNSKYKFSVGMVTVTDPNDSLYRYTNRESTLKCINEKLVKRLGGHIRVRKSGNTRYIDYLADLPNTNSQVIRFGENLMDFTKNFDMSDLATVIIPLGARLEEKSSDFPQALDEYTTIASVNDGKEYLGSASAVAKYGWIEKVVNWDDVNDKNILKAKGQKYLSDIQFENMVLEIKAIDLHDMDVDVESIKLLDSIRAVSEPHGLDRFFPVAKMTIPLDSPSGKVFTLGTEVRQSLTDASNKVNDNIIQKIERLPATSKVLQEARDNATQLIHNATHGYVVTTANEQLIMDTNDIKTAKKVWRWNINGLGYSKNGYNGDYNTAITMNGAIIADFITSGTMSADRIRGGTLELGGTGFGKNGSIVLKNASGTEIGRLDKNGLVANSGKFKGDITGATGTFSGAVKSSNSAFYMEMSDGQLYGCRANNAKSGYIDFNNYLTATGEYGLRMAGKGCAVIMTPSFGVADYQDGGYVTYMEGQSGTQEFIQNIQDNGDGTISWYKSTITYTKGIMTTKL